MLRGLWMLTVCCIVTGSLLPGDSPPMRALEHLNISDKIEHFIAYCAVAFLPAVRERWKTVAAAALWAVAMGISLEFGQRYVSGRSFEVADMMADALGTCCGLGLGMYVRTMKPVRTVRCAGKIGRSGRN